MLCYILRLSLKQSYSKNKQIKTAQLLYSQSSIWREQSSSWREHVLKDHAIFNLVMHWSRAVVSARGQQLRNCIQVGIHLNLISGTWPRINQSQCSSSRSIKTQKENLANIQQAWSITDLLYDTKNTKKMIFVLVYLRALKRKPVIYKSVVLFSLFSFSLRLSVF